MWPVSLWKEEICTLLRLNIEYPSQVPVWDVRSLAGPTILEDCGNFRRWGLAGENRSAGQVFGRYIIPSHFLP